MSRSAQHQRIATRYAAGDPIADIAAEECVDPKTVRNVARRFGLPRRLPDQTERNARIAARYAAGEPVVRIATDEGVGHSCVRNVAKRAGLPPRKGWQRHYPINESAFDEPNEVGWWLIGLIAADGSINSKQSRISVAQRAEDADVLYAFLRYVGSEGRPLTRIEPKRGWSAGGSYREARVFSERLCAPLARHGIVPGKTRSRKLSHEAAAQPAVWLGLLDGDGSAGATRHYGNPRIDFYGTHEVMQQCSWFWSQHLVLQTGRPPALTRHQGGLTKMALHGSNAAIAARIMLASSPVSLARKRRILKRIAEYQRAPHWRVAQTESSVAA